MAATPEAKVKTKIKEILKRYSVYYAMPIGTGYGNSGVPDFLCCVDGKFLAIEAKAGANQPTELQQKNMRSIREARGEALVINENSLAMLETMLKKWKGVA